MKCRVDETEGGYRIVATEGEIAKQHVRHFEHVYKHKHVAVARAKKIERETDCTTSQEGTA